ncbi:LytR C-terminal domain-containing protein [Janthinobacterium fluminis]|uniref:Tetratricopeptide repeat protein n=1 Tax=Janthinobacterium fluminis TaxID=2987524 RepID=A0ABT5K2Q3_9BURK|nr:LytR C-terminal domain-containing protein [Janthinobacterium fluminis]MDC8759258.1 tetratricopeptide repeat protein [Janthinobacterium fluminis]
MFKLRPLLAAIVGAGLLQGCATPPASQLLSRPAATATAHNAATYYRLGKHLQERGELQLALAAYTLSLEFEPGQLEARNAAAALHARQGQLEQAAALLRQVVADFPGAAHPYNNLGYVYYMQGNYAAATATLRQALALDGQNELARNNLALAEAAGAAGAGVPDAAAPLIAAEAAPVATPPAAPAQAPEPAVAAPAQPLAQAAAPPQLAPPAPVAPPAPAAVAEVAAPPGRVELVQLKPNEYQLKFNAVPTLAAIVPLPVARPAAPSAAAVAATPEAQQRAGLEVANGNGVTGMAKRMRHVLAQMGIPVRRLRNERPYTQRNTTILYRPGFEREAAALQNALKGLVALQASKYLAEGADLRLVLGKDAKAQLARLDAAADLPLLALNDSGN